MIMIMTMTMTIIIIIIIVIIIKIIIIMMMMMMMMMMMIEKAHYETAHQKLEHKLLSVWKMFGPVPKLSLPRAR